MHPDHGHPHTHGEGAGVPARPGAGRARALRIGVGGPVGSGKTALVAALCRALGMRVRLAVPVAARAPVLFADPQVVRAV